MTIRTYRLIPTLFVFLAGSSSAVAQDRYEVALSKLANAVNTSLSISSTEKVFVAEFKRMDGAGCDLDRLITEDFEAALMADSHTYKLLDRANLEALGEEHKLEMQGMMDEEQRMRKAGMLLKADAIVIGSYRMAGNTLILRVKAIDVQSSEQLAIVPASCWPTSILKKLCAESPRKTDEPVAKPSKPESNSGRAGITSEAEVLPEPCDRTTGSFCFTNNSSATLTVGSGKLSKGNPLRIPPGRTDCFYDMPVGPFDFSLLVPARPNTGVKRRVADGNLRIEPCKTQTYIYP